MGWKIVEIETNEYIQLYLNNLLIKRDLEKILVNLNDIDTLIIHNDRAAISIKLLNALSMKNVNVILMNSKHEPQSYVIPVSGNHMSLKILQMQISWSNQYKGRLWKEVIKNKIYNQAKLLEIIFEKPIDEKFKELINNVKSHDVSNREGHAAKIFWHSLFGINFKRDQKCLSNTVINSMLNYGYALVRSLMIRSIYKKGLDPRISLFHKSFSNFFALASDLMEPFRQLIDYIVYKNKDTEFFTILIKEKLLEFFDCKVKIDGKAFFVSKAMDIVVEKIIKNVGWTWVDLWD